MNKISFFAIAACGAVLSFSSCKKETKPKPEVAAIPCTADVYGYLGTTTTLTNCTFGKIDETTGGITSLSSLLNHSYTTAGAYNSSNNCYYMFRAGLSSTDTLYKINSGGVVTKLTCTAGGHRTGLVYNPITNKLYCISVSSAGSSIAEINESGATFSITNLAATLHDVENYALDLTSITVSNATGEIFYTTSDLSNSYIEKYHPGSPAPVVVLTTTAIDYLFGIAYNDNNNKIYAFQRNATNFVRIDPVSGSLTVLSTLGIEINGKHYSACFNSCNSSYIFSSMDSAVDTNTFGHLYKIDTLGAIVTSNATSGIYQGLTVKY